VGRLDTNLGNVLIEEWMDEVNLTFHKRGGEIFSHKMQKVEGP
jgi:hypothetical protein